MPPEVSEELWDRQKRFNGESDVALQRGVVRVGGAEQQLQREQRNSVVREKKPIRFRGAPLPERPRPFHAAVVKQGLWMIGGGEGRRWRRRPVRQRDVEEEQVHGDHEDCLEEERDVVVG